MIDIYDSETLIKIYRMLDNKCNAIDKFIQEHALCFGPCTFEFGSEEVCNNIINLITRKNQLINLKIIIDNAVKKLCDKDKKILYLKMYYTISMEELCGVLELKARTAFRRIEHAFTSLCEELNNSKHCHKLENILNAEDWIFSIREEIKNRRMAFKSKEVGS